MVQAIENLTRISGRILARRQHERLGAYDVLTLAIEHTEPVPEKADLLGQFAGGTVEVTVRRALLGDASVGARFRCRAERTPDGAMAEPHPDPKDFEIGGSVSR